MEKLVCPPEKCVGCAACAAVCPKSAIDIKDYLHSNCACIDLNKCINCKACEKVCINHNVVSLKEPKLWKQGWSRDEKTRLAASSGGFAGAIIKHFLSVNGVVCSAIFQNGKFKFYITEDIKDADIFCGSKYVKINPYEIYEQVKDYLCFGRKVLFIGLPCQVAAIKLFVGEKYCEYLYTIDLICHGTPSYKNIEIFLNQYDISLDQIEDISFRKKGCYQISGSSICIEPKGVLDRYTLAFLNGINFTQNCYTCHFASLQRISDLTIGDSWGTELDEKEKANGISLALCMSEKGEYLLDIGDLYLTEVNLDKAVNHNNQLREPIKKPKNYDEFFDAINRGISYNGAVKRSLPKQCRNQKIKRFLRDFTAFNVKKTK